MSFEKKSINTVIERLIPDFIRDEYPNYVVFVEAYFRYMERDLGEQDLISNILAYNDIDELSKVTPDAHTHLANEFLNGLPSNLKVELPLLVKQIRGFYRAKGTEKSFRFLFRVLYDEAVDFYYPSKNILRASDGKWYQPTFVLLTNRTFNDLSHFVKQYIHTSTGATAFSADILQLEYPSGSGISEYFLDVSEVVGDFVIGDTLLNAAADWSDIISDVVYGTGRWLNTDGFVSSDMFVQDNFFYQDFSYQLISPIPSELYLSMVKRLVHPAGMKLFAKFAYPDGVTITVGSVGVSNYFELDIEGSVTTPLSSVKDDTISFALYNNPIPTFSYAWIEANKQYSGAPSNFNNIFPDMRILAFAKFSSFTDTPTQMFMNRLPSIINIV